MASISFAASSIARFRCNDHCFGIAPLRRFAASIRSKNRCSVPQDAQTQPQDEMDSRTTPRKPHFFRRWRVPNARGLPGISRRWPFKGDHVYRTDERGMFLPSCQSGCGFTCSMDSSGAGFTASGSVAFLWTHLSSSNKLRA